MKTGSNREINNPDNYKLSVFYYNPKDKRVIVPKLDIYRGWTLNFGNIYTYMTIVVLLLIGLFIGLF